jgi:bifunctional non-homologous end joining protein LigD
MIQPILPMLATSAQPFDSDEYVFEVKWDGVRALAAVDQGQWRLWGRQRASYDGRYPELEVLRRLPAGTVVDGELVVFQDGRPDLHSILRRHQLVHAARIRHASAQVPVHYLLFDILYHRGRSLLQEPWQLRRAVLADVVAAIDVPQLAFSAALAGPSQDVLARVVAQGHEGIMAKHRSSRYLPGQRSAAWRKIKPVQVLPCVIIGYTPSAQGIGSLLVASAHQGPLRYVGQVSSGLSEQLKRDLGASLARRRRPQPVVACRRSALWVKPDLYCQVRFLNGSGRGQLRSPCFVGLLETPR